uniref:Uncharacterized protein n=1 Tax=Lactuca sativa TaxID=4236 RepID=A0A9R1XCQ4_LACSA|nr:hypothetical protein LSAT_V11C500242630 [Lactuca sativa]
MDEICHVYVLKSTHMEKGKNIILDAKTDYPVACNVMETLLVHEELLQNGDNRDTQKKSRLMKIGLSGTDYNVEKKKKIKKVIEKYWKWDLTNNTQHIWLRNPKKF